MLVLSITGCWRDHSGSDIQCWSGWVQGSSMQDPHDLGVLVGGGSGITFSCNKGKELGAEVQTHLRSQRW